MVGCGFVDGIILHPTAHHVRYCRTDMGGAYRWDAYTGREKDLWIAAYDGLYHSTAQEGPGIEGFGTGNPTFGTEEDGLPRCLRIL